MSKGEAREVHTYRRCDPSTDLVPAAADCYRNPGALNTTNLVPESDIICGLRRRRIEGLKRLKPVLYKQREFIEILPMSIMFRASLTGGVQGILFPATPLSILQDHYAIDFADLETKLSDGVKMMILCSPHNPVGRVWSREELLQIGALCLRHNVLVVSDEIHADLVFFGHSHIPFAALTEELAQHSLVFAAPSKTFNIAGLHKSYAIIPNATLRQQFHDELRRLALTSENVLSALATQVAYSQGAPWLDEMLAYLESNLDWLETFVASRMPGVHMIRPQGTHLVWLDFCSFSMAAEQLQAYILQEAKVALSDGKTFGASGAGFLRMNIACTHTTLQTGLERIANALEQLSPHAPGSSRGTSA